MKILTKSTYANLMDNLHKKGITDDKIIQSYIDQGLTPKEIKKEILKLQGFCEVLDGKEPTIVSRDRIKNQTKGMIVAILFIVSPIYVMINWQNGNILHATIGGVVFVATLIYVGLNEFIDRVKGHLPD